MVPQVDVLGSLTIALVRVGGGCGSIGEGSPMVTTVPVTLILGRHLAFISFMNLGTSQGGNFIEPIYLHS